MNDDGFCFQIIISRDRQIERLERELESARSESALAREETARMVKHFEAERIHWLDEKEKVIRQVAGRRQPCLCQPRILDI